MMDHFLTSVLQVVIILDILGLVGYFVLGSLKSKKKRTSIPAPVQARGLPLATPRFFTRLRQRFTFSRSEGPESLEAALGNLKRVLYSYQQGLV